MKSQLVSSILTSEVVTVSPDTPIAEAISLMEKNNISCMVVAEGNRPVGIFTEKDLVFMASHGDYKDDLKINDVMSTSVITVGEDMNILEAYQVLESNKIRHLVVVNDSDEIAGVLTHTNIVSKLGLEYFIELKSIEKLISKNVVTIAGRRFLREAVVKMAEYSISCLVVEENRVPVGILTERDIVHLFRRGEDVGGLIVEDVMSRPVETVRPDITVHEAANIMSRKKMRRLVVVDAKGRISGLITQHDIIKNFEFKYIEFLKEVIHEKEQALQKNEKLLSEKMVLDNILRYSTDMAIIATDLDSRIVYYNPAAERIFGYKTEDALGKEIILILDEERKERRPTHFEEARRTVRAGDAYCCTFERNAGAKTIFIESTITGLRDEFHTLAGYALMAMDITNHRESEEEIRRNYIINGVINRILSLSLDDISLNEILKRSLDLVLSVPDLAFELKGGIFLADDEQKMLVLKAHKELSDSVQEACSSVPFGVCLCGRAAAERRIVFADSVHGHHGKLYENIPPHGHYSIPIMFGERPLGVICIYVEEGHSRNRKEEDFLTAVANTLSGVIVRKQMEKNLMEVNARLQTLIHAIPDAISFKDLHGRHIVVNKAFEELVGLPQSEILGKNCEELQNPDMADNLRTSNDEAIKSLKPHRIEERFIGKDGDEIYLDTIKVPLVDDNDNVVGLLGVSRNITELKKMEEAVITAKKLESIGVLAGGIAHDFNNLMTGVLGNIYLAKTLVKPGEWIYELLDRAEKVSMSTKHLTHQLLTFSRGGHPVKRVFDIRDLIREYAMFPLKGSNIKCDFHFSDNLWSVEADTEQIIQVVQNLVNNAKESMTGFGTITVCAENITVTAKDSLPVEDGDYVKITVDDEGIGIPQECLHKIFDPYFTSKQLDYRKGSGLGLAICYSIIKKHDGLITVKSEEGLGTSISFYLPAFSNKVCTNAPEETSSGCHGRILLMDDEDVVRGVAGETLRSIGYKVELACDGVEAIDLYKRAMESGTAFDAVILDLTIKGGMGGRETMQGLLQIDPNVKAVVSSGYSNDSVMAEYQNYGFRSALVKPYTIQGLRDSLQEALYGQDKNDSVRAV